MDQEVLFKAREWKPFLTGLRMLGKDHFLRAIVSKLHVNFSSQLWDHIRNFTTGSLMSQLQMRSSSNRQAVREGRGRGRAGLGSCLSFWKVTFMGRTLVTSVGSFLKSCLAFCCHFLELWALFYCSDSLHLNYSSLCLNVPAFFCVVKLSPIHPFPHFLAAEKSFLPNPCLPRWLFCWDNVCGKVIL